MQTLKKSYFIFPFSQLLTLVGFLLLCCLETTTAQSWERLIGDTGLDEGTGILSTQDGNFLAVGRRASLSGGDMDIYLVKFTRDNQIVWEQTFGGNGVDEAYDVVEMSDGSFAVVGTSNSFSSGDNDLYLLIVDEDGEELWAQTYGDSINQEGFSIGLMPDQGFLLGGVYGVNANLIRVDRFGDVVWEKRFDPNVVLISDIEVEDSNRIYVVGSEFSAFNLYQVTPSGDYSLLGSAAGKDLYVASNGDLLTTGNDAGQVLLARSKPDGTILWQKDLSTALAQTESLVELDNENILVGGSGLLKTDEFGNLLWSYEFDAQNTLIDVANDFTVDSSGIYLTGYRKGMSGLPEDMLISKTHPSGNINTNLITGKLFADTLENCSLDSGEPLLGNWLIKVSGSREFWTTTDSLGAFSIFVNQGTFVLEAIPQGQYWENCQPLTSVSFTQNWDTSIVNLPMQREFLCPEMEVDISAAFLRRCFTNTYYVNYCNTGTVAANNSYVEITLDSFLNFEQSAQPYIELAPNLYQFDLGDVAPGECGRFSFSALLSCQADLGQTHCTEARIFPDSICDPPMAWSGASIEVDGACQGDSVKFVIRNKGSEGMTVPVNYIIIEDVVMYRQTRPSLLSGDSTVIALPSNGATYIIQVEQEPGHPGFSFPTVGIEGCGTNGNGSSTQGVITQFPNDEADPFVSIDCQQNRGSFDPNDKQGFPVGFGPEHFIERDVDIEYLIRFQNTGTDTAFRVVIKDTLSPLLDLERLQLGSSSHPFLFEIEDERTMVFRFDPIALPDSNINEPASHGFVKFKVAQQSDLPEGTIINNSASIYFDFNEPIKTNRTLHTIGRNFVELIVNTFQEVEGSQWKVFPNPMSESTLFESKESKAMKGVLTLYDVTGKEVRRIRFDQDRIYLKRENLLGGIYFYQIENNEGIIKGKGKIIIL